MILLILFSILPNRALATELIEAEPRFPECQSELTFAPALNAIRIHPRFSNFPWIRHRVDQVREYGQPYLTEREMTDLVGALDDVENNRGNTYHSRSVVAVLLNVAEDNLAREFSAQVDRVVTDLERNARIVLENGDSEYHAWLTELLARMKHYRGGISIERGAWYWQYARYEAEQVHRLELPDWIAERRRSVAVTEPRVTQGNFDFLIKVPTLGKMRKRYALRLALTTAYDRTPALEGPIHTTMASLPDLNSALSFLVGAPNLNVGGKSGTLLGSAAIGGVITPITITFDAHHRYFTVRAVTLNPAAAPYYQMVVAEDGQLEFLELAPIDPNVADRRPDLTHFAY